VLLAGNLEIEMSEVLELAEEWIEVAVYRPRVSEQRSSIFIFGFWHFLARGFQVLSILALLKCLDIV